jgi:hypothetical protein
MAAPAYSLDVSFADFGLATPADTLALSLLVRRVFVDTFGEVLTARQQPTSPPTAP